MNRRSFFALIGAAIAVPFLPKAQPKPVIHTLGYLQHGPTGAHGPQGDPGMIWDPGHQHTVWHNTGQNPYQLQGLNPYHFQGVNRWQNQSI